MCALSIPFVCSDSLFSNNTSVKRSSGSKNQFNFVAADQTTPERRSSFVPKAFSAYLKKKFRDVGTVKIVIWNELDTKITEARWSARNVAFEAPIARSIDPADKQPGILFGHYVKWITMSDPRTLWVSYKLTDGYRVCIFGKVEISEVFQWRDPKFFYTVYLTGENDCDVPELPPKHVFISENRGNGYKSNWKYVEAECAIASVGLDHVLHVYVLGLKVRSPPLETEFQAWEDLELASNPSAIQKQGSTYPYRAVQMPSKALTDQNQELGTPKINPSSKLVKYNIFLIIHLLNCENVGTLPYLFGAQN